MDTIERAANKLTHPRDKSAIERAAEGLPGPVAPPELAPADSKESLVEETIAAAEPRLDFEPSDSIGLEPEIRIEPSDPETDRVIKIDLDKIGQIGLVSPIRPTTRLAEEYRLIKRPLLMRAFEKANVNGEQSNRLILVTSGQPREGKTFTAINLAISMAAEQDIHVLLVDGDVVNPNVCKILGVKMDLGLLDVLVDPSLDLGRVIRPTNIGKLSLLHAGRGHSMSTELLSSRRMAEVVGELGSRYDDRIIICDSPPLLATSEPTVLAYHAGQIVLVVEADKTSERAIKTALQMLGNRNDVVTVLNKATSVIGSSTFGSYYGYYGKYKKYKKQDV